MLPEPFSGVCVHVCIVCVRVYAYVWCMHVCVCVCVYVWCVSMSVFVCSCMFICAFVCMYVCDCVHMCVWVCVHQKQSFSLQQDGFREERQCCLLPARAHI